MHPDVSLDFQLNRWATYGGKAWLREVEPVLPRLTDYFELTPDDIEPQRQAR